MDLNGVEINYILRRSSMNKTISVKISRKKGILVSAPPEVSTEQIESFIRVRADGILASVSKYEVMNTVPKAQRSLDNLCKLVNKYVYKYYYAMKSVHEMPEFPTIKYRFLKARWGICKTDRNELVFNTQLANKPKEAVEYVVVHEMSHFIVPGHSKIFYEEIERFLPDWKVKRKMLRNDGSPDDYGED